MEGWKIVRIPNIIDSDFYKPGGEETINDLLKKGGRMEKNWRFLTFQPVFPELDEIIGGAQVRPYELFTNIAEMGYSVHVWKIRGGSRKTHENDGLKISSLNLPKWKTIAEVKRWIDIFRVFLWEVKQAREEGDKICLYQQVPCGIVFKLGIPIHINPGFFLFPLARQAGVFTWASMHDLSPDHETYIVRRMSKLDQNNTRLQKWIIKASKLATWEQHFALKYASFVTVVSEEMRKLVLSRYNVHPERVKLFRSAVDSLLVENIGTWIPPSGGPWTIGYVGSVRDANLYLLKEATSLLRKGDPSFRLLIGSVTAENISELFRGIEVSLQNKKYKDFPEIAKQVDLWVIPYDEEAYLQMAWELKIPMYLSSGRPVIRTWTPEVEHSELKPYLFLTGTTPESIAETIQYVFAHPEEAKTKASSGRQFVLQNMTWGKISYQLLQELEKVCRAE